jgi:FixJ family two-component response regulator
MLNRRGCVAIVDDDRGIRRSLERLLRAAGFEASTYGSAEEFLNRSTSEQPACLILDIRLPGMSGLELARHLESEDIHVPTIFITAQEKPWEFRKPYPIRSGDLCLLKPFSESALLSAIRSALSC